MPFIHDEEVLKKLEQRKLHNDYTERIGLVQKAMTPEWQAGMAQSLSKVIAEPASVKSKLPKLYSLIAQADERRSAHAACHQGCDACCHMQVEMPDIEAERIGQAIGRAPVKLRPGRHTTPIERLGRPETPCPFLVNHTCSIYDYRPFVCRDFVVLDVDALTCSFENMALAREGDPRMATVPQSTGTPVAQAFGKLAFRANAAFADIRQFFPGSPEKTDREVR